MNKKYKNSPIIEAVCEFRFDPTSTWDPTIPGLLYERIKNNFPKKKKIQQHELMFTIDTKAGLKQQQQLTIKERAQFLQEDEKLFIQVDENLLAINHLKPYSSWSNFFSIIKDTFKIYQEIAGPKVIQRIGLRYINQIEIPQSSVELEDYFNFRPYVSDELPQDLESIMAGVIFVFENGRDQAKVQLANRPSQQGKSVFVLDIDYFLAKPSTITSGDVSDWVDTAHNEVEKIFEGAITEKTREFFK